MQINLNVNRSLLTNINKLSQIHRRYESLWTVEQGPKNPYYRDGVTPGMRNHLGARSAGGGCSFRAPASRRPTESERERKGLGQLRMKENRI